MAGVSGSAPSSDLPDEVLAVRAREGDPRAFEVLLRRHQRMAFATALRIVGRRSDAEDATQDAFVTAWRRLPEFRGDAAFSTWLHRIVTTRALNQIRARSRHDDRRSGPDIADFADAVVPVTSDASPEAAVQAGALVDALHTALAALSEQQRWCWVLRELQGCSYEEIADMTGTSVTAVRGRLHRARIALAASMGEWR